MSDEYVAILEKNDRKERKAILVPRGQSLDFDEGSIMRHWLHPYLGREWHLVEFVHIANPLTIDDGTVERVVAQFPDLSSRDVKLILSAALSSAPTQAVTVNDAARKRAAAAVYETFSQDAADLTEEGARIFADAALVAAFPQRRKEPLT